MAKAPKLKVFRTPIGFHDAYVAAPSQKAALAAWGADANLFARGIAEQITDPNLMEEALARPGEVIRKLRGGLDDHLGALPPDPKAAATARTAKRPAVRPSRAKLEAAEQALSAAEAEQAAELGELVKREQALARERRALQARHAKALEGLAKRRDQAQRDHDVAIAKWRG